MQEWPQLVGRRFGDVLLSFPDAVPIGIKKKEHVGVFLNPTDHYVMQPGAYPFFSGCALLTASDVMYRTSIQTAHTSSDWEAGMLLDQLRHLLMLPSRSTK